MLPQYLAQRFNITLTLQPYILRLKYALRGDGTSNAVSHTAFEVLGTLIEVHVLHLKYFAL